MLKNEKPKDCLDCIYFDENGKHLKSGKAHFPSLCEKDLLWFKCGGKYGLKKLTNIREVKNMENKEKSEVLKKIFEENKKINEEFYELFKKATPKGFDKMKGVLGEKRYDILNIISGTLLSDAVIFMKKIGVLEEFLENKNEISRMLINSILENREKE